MLVEGDEEELVASVGQKPGHYEARGVAGVEDRQSVGGLGPDVEAPGVDVNSLHEVGDQDLGEGNV